MFKITSIEAAELIRNISENVRDALNRKEILREVKSDAARRVSFNRTGADDQGEVTAFVSALQALRTKDAVFNLAIDAYMAAMTFIDMFTACRRADLTVKRCAEAGFTVTRDQVFATENAKATQHYSVSAAVAELRQLSTESSNVNNNPNAPKDDCEQKSPQWIWVISREPFSPHLDARPIESYIDKRRLIKETPKGLRLEISYSDNGTFFAHDRYKFFYGERAAIEWLANEANKMAAFLEERKRSMVTLLCSAHDAIRKLEDK